MKRLSLIRVLLSAALLSACMGGTGTDTDNGMKENTVTLGDYNGTAARVVDSDGRPIAGVAIILHTPGYRPDSGAPEPLVLEPSRPLVTDSQGYSRFDLMSPGKFVVEGRLGAATLFFDTLAVADARSLAVYTFRARPTTSAKGRVRLASGLKVVSGAVFLRGTARWSPLDSAGVYE
ncbi:MAG TPA: hypothetical protein VK465_14215, partial [Fibrobacteria bacterium]|nr:hypothetical protein [Fibrobacteria bacterium]